MTELMTGQLTAWQQLYLQYPPPDIVATAVPDGDPGETVENTVKDAVIPASK